MPLVLSIIFLMIKKKSPIERISVEWGGECKIGSYRRNGGKLVEDKTPKAELIVFLNELDDS